MRYSWIVGGVVFVAACSAATPGSQKGTNNGTGTGDGAGAGSGTNGGSGAGAIGSGTAGNSSNGTGTGSGGGAGSGTGTGNPTGQGDSCPTVKGTRACCGAGIQTCNSSGEFLQWGPCIDKSGLTMTKCTIPSGCGVGEFGPNCDGGIDAGPIPPKDAGVPTLPPAPKLCTDPTVSTEPQIIAGYSPTTPQTVGANGQIKVWVTDECPAFISTGEVVDATTGMITTPGDRTALAADNYLDEPALYIAPQSADNGGTPHFPQYVKGDYNNQPFNNSNPLGILTCVTNDKKGPALDAPPAGTAPLTQSYNTEFVWDVNKLGLAPGSYIAEFSIHDGDRERAIGCVNIVISGTN